MSQQDITISFQPQRQVRTLHRDIDWRGAFWISCGVPVLVLFSMGAISSTVGNAAWLVWMVSIGFGFLQAFTYAEIAGLFPHKAGGVSVFGAVAWVRYSKLLAPVSIWCHWWAWSPVLAIGSGLGAGYMLNALFAPEAAINNWQLTLLDLGLLKDGLTLRINATFIVGATVLLLVFAIQNGGILRSARTMMILALTALLPLLLIALVPLLTGDLPQSHFFPLSPLAYNNMGEIVAGEWNRQGWVLLAGGLFIAGWSAYAFETAACYTREFKHPGRDSARAIFYAGLLCLAVYMIVPTAFQGYLGQGEMIQPAQIDNLGRIVEPAQYSGMLSEDIYSGVGIADVLAAMAGNIGFVANLIVVMLVLAMLLAIMTAMSGSSRTLYQGAVDGLLPRFLAHVNEDGAPTHAMWANLVLNLVLLMMSDYVFVLAASNVGYMIFNFLNLNAGWIHRMDRGNWQRPFRAPTLLLIIGIVLAFLNLAIMGMGANVWGEGALLSGLFMAALSIPIFLWRHYVTDKGQFPTVMQDDMKLDGVSKGNAGILPYLAVLLGAVTVYVANVLVASV